MEVVQYAWNTPASGDPLQILSGKLKAVKHALIYLNRVNGNLHSNVEKSRALFHATQQAITLNPTDPLLLSLQQTQSATLWADLLCEEKLLKQKSRIQWLKEGDKNTGFFHNQIKNRWNHNKTLSIENAEGDWCYGHSAVQGIAVDHFHSLLGSPAVDQAIPDLESVESVISSKISSQQALLLERDITDEEILNTLKHIKKNKSPGPDGFNVNFFILTWDIVGPVFTAAIQSFFRQGCLLRGTNATAIALVPKNANPSSMNDYRPISCCNTTYKCISKIIASRLMGIFPSIISPNQAVFIKGRRIGDNILLAQELFRNYHRPYGPPRCALKIDFRKAFDSISWDFLMAVLRSFNFPPKFLFWIKACITSTTFSVKVNGALCGYFKGYNGLRQGDPLSPYLFVIILEVLSVMLARASKLPSFHNHWKTDALSLSHLCFADDLIIFCRGDIGFVNTIKNCMDLSSSQSGLRINASKSMCFLSHVPPDTSEDIMSTLGFQLGSFPAKFLGVPLITTKLSLADCQPLLEKLKSRITSWTNCFLSYAGRLQLIKSVIHSIQAYWSAHFILPASAINDMKSSMSRFLWKGPSMGKSGAKVAWNKIILPIAEGGLAIKNLEEWNKAQILMHLWQIISPSSSFWAKWVRVVHLKNKYFWIIIFFLLNLNCIKKKEITTSWESPIRI